LSDPYLDPTAGVLRNRYGITNPEVLQRLETYLTRHRQRERLRELPMTPAGFCKVHRHLMGDVYAWAGEPRRMDMYLADYRGRILARFEPEARIRPGLQRIFSELRADHCLAGSALARFAGKAAHYIAELNGVHPFREGNGRTMRFWLRELAEQAGYALDLALVDRDGWIQASIAGHAPRRDHEPMAAVIKRAITGSQEPRSPRIPVGAIPIEDARVAVLKHLASALDQAAGRLATLRALGPITNSTELNADHMHALKISDWLASKEEGPIQQLEILRAAGVRTISVPSMDGMTDLERVLAIGKVTRQELRALSPQELARARDIALGDRA
jgi:cell filamentation protein, protein adenylyltransferase